MNGKTEKDIQILIVQLKLSIYQGVHDNTEQSNVHHVQETPSRILTNPTIGGGGVISVTDTSNSMVRLDTNGLTKTVMVAETDLGID